MDDQVMPCESVYELCANLQQKRQAKTERLDQGVWVRLLVVYIAIIQVTNRFFLNSARVKLQMYTVRIHVNNISFPLCKRFCLTALGNITLNPVSCRRTGTSTNCAK